VNLDQKRVFSQLFEASPNTVMLNRPMLIALGAVPSILLSLLFQKEAYTAQGNRKFALGEDWFNLTHVEIEEATGFLKNRIVETIETLRKSRVVEVERRGIPPMNYYRLDYDMAFEIMAKSLDEAMNPKGWESQPMKVGNPNLQRSPFPTYNTRPSKDSNKPSIQEVGLLDSRDSADQEGPKEAPRKKVNDTILPILSKAITLGGFTNKLPGPGKAPTGVLLSAQKFLMSAHGGRLRRDYEFKNIEGGSISKLLKERGLTPVLYEACERFAQMRQEGWDPVNKKGLTLDISTFFYNKMTHFSWFIFCAFNAPSLSAPQAAQQAFAKLQLDEGERAALDAIRGEDPDNFMFTKKVLALHEWYYDKKRDLRMYAAFLGIAHLWAQYFGTFKDLCERLLDFSSEWADWKPANFGYGNATWKRFEVWVKERYEGLDLCPPEKKMALATASWQRDHSDDRAAEQKRAEDKKAFDEAEEAFKKDLEKPFPGEGFDGREDAV
jgi:hypothetical protein